MRTLNWKSHLGSVTLDLELEDRTLTNLTVPPFHAAIILHFQEKSRARPRPHPPTAADASTLSPRQVLGIWRT